MADDKPWRMKNLQLKVCQVAHVWLAQLDKHETSDPVMVSGVG